LPANYNIGAGSPLDVGVLPRLVVSGRSINEVLRHAESVRNLRLCSPPDGGRLRMMDACRCFGTHVVVERRGNWEVRRPAPDHTGCS